MVDEYAMNVQPYYINGVWYRNDSTKVYCLGLNDITYYQCVYNNDSYILCTDQIK